MNTEKYSGTKPVLQLKAFDKSQLLILTTRIPLQEIRLISSNELSIRIYDPAYDVETAFLDGFVEEDIHMWPPQGIKLLQERYVNYREVSMV